MGIDLKNGATLAVDEWNARGGVLGKKIVLQIEDDQHDPKQAVSVANKLVNSGAVGVIGHWNSSSSIPASGVYHQAGIVMITPASTNPQLTEQGYPDVFRVCGRDDQQGRVAAEFTLIKLKAKRIGILHDKTTYGQGLADEYKKALGDRATVVYYAGITQGDKDFRGILTTLKGTKPDLLFFGGIYPEAGLLIRQARELGLAAPMMSGDGTIDQKFVDIAGAAAEGTYLTFSPDPQKIPFAKTFLENYHRRFGQHGPYSIYAYDATNIILAAIDKVATVDGSGNLVIDPQKLIDAVRATSYTGASGQIDFDDKGDRKVVGAVNEIDQVKNGKLTRIQ